MATPPSCCDIVRAHCALSGRLHALYTVASVDLMVALHDAKPLRRGANPLAEACTRALVFLQDDELEARQPFPSQFMDTLQRVLVCQIKHAGDFAADAAAQFCVALDNDEHVNVFDVYYCDGAHLAGSCRDVYEAAKRAVRAELGPLHFDGENRATFTADDARLLHRYSDALLAFMDEAVALCADVLGERHDDTRALANEARRVRRLRQLHDECCV